METIEKVLEGIKLEIKSYLIQIGIEEPIIEIGRSTDLKFGDFSTGIALKYSKKVNQDSYSFAEMILQKISGTHRFDGIDRITILKPGFINFFLSNSFFEKSIQSILVHDEEYGKNNSLQNEKWVVEHTSPNPNKAMHLGHLRNNLVGTGIVRLLSWNGADVVSDAVYNNRGIAIAKLMWGFLAHMRKDEKTPVDTVFWEKNRSDWFSPSEKGVKPDLFVTSCYIYGENDFKANLESNQQIRNLVISWEEGDALVWKLWEHVLKYAYEGIDRTLARLGSTWDKIWYEHEHYSEGKKFVEIGLKNKIFKMLDDGAVLTDLSEYNLPDTILLKNDSTSLYITQDIALTYLKKKYYNANKLVWVIGPEQSMAMKQLFAISEQLDIGKLHDFTHIPYGYVGLKDGSGGFKKMSSREGNVVLIDDVIDEAFEKINKRFITNGKVPSTDLDAVCEKMALAAVKFSILRSNRTQDLTFDTDQSIDISGDSGIYVMYTYVRAQSILRKSGRKPVANFHMPENLGSSEELMRLLVLFPEIVKKSKDDLSVHHVAQYLLELCSAFNSWYGNETVLDGSSNEDYKLSLTQASGIVIKNGLHILGISTVAEI